MSIFAAIFFGWLYVLVRTAFKVNTALCYDCGASRRYRTTGSKLAMVLLAFIALLLFLKWRETK